MAGNPWGLTVTLRPHVGQYESPIGPAEVEFPQWMVMAASRQIEMNYGVSPVECGLAGFETRTVEFHAHANKWPQAAKDFICDEVARISGFPRRANSPVLPVVGPVVDVDDLDTDEVIDEVE